MLELSVREVRFYTPDIFELFLERGGYEFETGECAVLFDSSGDSRPYSISSAPNDPVLSFLIRRQPGGSLSNFLAERSVGDSVRISLPFGDFRPSVSERPAVLIATGVGIAPFLSLVRSGGQVSCLSTSASLFCLYGVRYVNEVIEHSFFQNNSTLSLAVSREAVGGCYHGRVSGLIETIDLPDDADFFLCGYDSMIDDVFARLRVRGVLDSRIHTEVFFSSVKY